MNRALILALALLVMPASAQTGSDITPESVAAVDRALAYLADRQNDDGSWNGDIGYKLNQDYRVTSNTAAHPGVTALAGMAFLAAGNLPDRGRYGEVIANATNYILARVSDEGFISDNGTRMYSHAFATLFLAEVYGMSHNREFKDKLQASVDYIVEAQNAEGSWRYLPFAVESDMSITVCQLNALRAARNVGIRVPASTIHRAANYVADSYVGEDQQYMWRGEGYYDLGRGSFRYQAQRYTRSSFALTAAGLAAMHNAGLHGNEIIDAKTLRSIDLDESVDFLRLHYDWVSGDSQWKFHYFYWYGHYYATQALYVMGGAAWNWYYPQIRDEIVESQNASGAFPNTEGPGEPFSTAVGALILSLPYGYLPIFQR